MTGGGGNVRAHMGFPDPIDAVLKRTELPPRAACDYAKPNSVGSQVHGGGRGVEGGGRGVFLWPVCVQRRSCVTGKK